MDLNITVGKDPFSLGENQLITVAVLNSSTGKELDSRFMGLELKDRCYRKEVCGNGGKSNTYL